MNDTKELPAEPEVKRWTTNSDRPAFPYNLNDACIVVRAPGLTKREWFAGMIAAGIATNCAYDYQNKGPKNVKLAVRAVDIADAILAELEKKP